jgi:SAM-dependent methyltransferase
LGVSTRRLADAGYSPEIQTTFGEEWTAHGDVLAEHTQEFLDYFDLLPMSALAGRRVVDLGCGSGRWASFVAPACATLVVVDFSDAILVARDNLRSHDNIVYILGDVLDLPFAPGAFDVGYSLGVLHHLPVDALDATRALANLAPELLVYLYYALDNRPPWFRWLLRGVTAMRMQLSRVTNRRARNLLTWALTVAIYLPLARVGQIVPERIRRSLPLAETYAGKSVHRMRQDVEDRFFTGIEQRVTRAQILALRDTFDEVIVSDGIPYWHFLCRRTGAESTTG